MNGGFLGIMFKKVTILGDLRREWFLLFIVIFANFSNDKNY